ncbi:metallochaperone Ccs1 [Schizosaccharomyces cryophilus OY26]|uniref:Metallochaperone Ccs1 n=1 Tax=Schizosaccharomyces cryophilus (strain OY26 / ATCC MYA-4695 / CBS 11777 / NBRC 106824 / NRRL Y48691) TaxID=653667 RepID=S9X675_SCHCR|nr:metallochaperone Ccs1 [Schizosaccharomyces cryophilus OY26]EPY52607.1 metallochaperone Ccs1 [Schizosaccharomyces cryophilus OY26]
MVQVEFLVRDCTVDVRSSIEEECKNLQIDEWKWDDTLGQLIVKSSLPPSEILHHLEKVTSKPILIRGASSQKESGVCILYDNTEDLSSVPKVYGLCRFIPTEDRVYLDLVATQLEPNTEYIAEVAVSGDISHGLKSVGGSFATLVSVPSNETGKIALAQEVDGNLEDWIGRAFVLKASKDSFNGVLGIVSRSAGVGQNTKVICACSGKSLWEEHAELHPSSSEKSCCKNDVPKKKCCC